MTEKFGQHYVLGFLFRERSSQVALIEKQKPDWQKSRLNGIGGKIEDGEQPLEAMTREFCEETGARIAAWRPFAILDWRGGFVHCFVAHGEHELTTTTDEKVIWCDVSALSSLPTIPKLRWLVPLALDESVTAAIDDRS